MADMECIYSYTREQAIADGVLVDVSDLARESGFTVPVAVTQGLYEGTFNPTEEEKSLGQSASGRLWDALFMLYMTIKGSKRSSSRIDYKIGVYRGNPPRYEEVDIKSVIGPGDAGEPVITIMLPHED